MLEIFLCKIGKSFSKDILKFFLTSGFTEKNTFPCHSLLHYPVINNGEGKKKKKLELMKSFIAVFLTTL